MRILVIGSGGREHALCWKLAQSPGAEIFAMPGNPGVARVATCIPGSDWLQAAETLRPDLTVVGPEAPLAAGIVDQFRARGFAIVGPTAKAARLETSKAFAKAFMQRAQIPTARFQAVENANDIAAALQTFSLPVVVKADGLMSGKGVVIAHSREDAHAAAVSLLAPGSRVVIEEFLAGEEVSFIVLTDGEHIVAFDASQDHKTLQDGDQGPNTGGMGAYADGRILTAAQKTRVMDTVIRPAIDCMRAEGTPFTGFLYAGLMMTADGPKVLEFNVRLGDPEAQVLMHRLNEDAAGIFEAAAHGQLRERELKSHAEPSVCVVLASAGYPSAPVSGAHITGTEDVSGTVVFHAGTQLVNGALVTAGGRVLGVTGRGATLSEAIAHTYAQAEKIHFDGMQFRRDIAAKGLRRWSDC